MFYFTRSRVSAAGACYYDSNQSMYVFGGCTQSSCNAAFNDLWRLDLNSKEWIRPLASGTCWRRAVKAAAVNYLKKKKKKFNKHVAVINT